MDAGRAAGTIPADSEHVIQIPWNDVEALQKVIDQHPGDIAGFISSPYDHPVFRDNELPADGYWQKIEALCRKNDIVLIVDDVRAGFRINLAGSNVAYGFTPDLICFGKAIANGYPLAALAGSDALKQAAQDVYFTGTQFFNAAPMAAARATLLELQKIDAANVMTSIGNKLNEGLIDVAASHGYDLVASGVPAMPYYRLANVDSKTHRMWIDECVGRGVYLLSYHNHFVSTAHTDADLQRTFEIVDDAFTTLGPASAQIQKAAHVMIAAYCWPQSARHKEPITLYCHTAASSFQIEVIRQGAEDKTVLVRHDLTRHRSTHHRRHCRKRLPVAAHTRTVD